MSQKLVTQPQHMPAPFQQGRALAASVNAGAVSVEQERAVAEAQGQLTLAKRFPRDLTAAHAELMTACKSHAFAAVAFYSKPQGDSTITGPSIRMAEEVARVVGNFQYGHRELSRDGKKSEVEVFAWDMEKNNYNKRQLTIMHVRDTRDGPKPLRDQADIDMKISNVASKQVRGLILAMMPKWLVEDAIQECKKTLAGTNDEPLEVRVRKMTQAFAKFGVTTEHLEKRLGHKLDAILLDELVEMMGIFNALREGEPASEYFGQQEAAEATAATAESIKATAAAAPRKPAAAKATPAPTPAPAPAPVEESKPVTKPSNTVKEQAPAPAVNDASQSEPDDGGDVF
jgi:hypothetical protein